MKPHTISRFFAAGLILFSNALFASANLIHNGDFETGNFTGWKVTHATTGSNISVGHGPGPDTTFGAFFGATGASFDSISQRFATTPGASYTLTFFYQPTNLGTPIPANNGFDVLWNGISIGGGLFPQFDVNPGFGTFTFNLKATGTSTTLTFNGRNASSFDFLDDVSVVANKIYVTSFKSGKLRVFLTNGMSTTPVKTQLNPAGVALASNGNVYVANFGANTVTTYDAAGKPINPTITGLSGPFALAFDQPGLLYVLNQTSNTITKYQANGTLLETINIPVVITSNGFAIAPDGSFWVSSSSDGNMLHIDAVGNLLATYSVGGTPAGVALPSDGTVLFADTNDNAVGRLDPSTGTVTTFVSGLAQPLGLAIGGNGNVYVGNSGNNTVTAYDSTGNATTPTISTSAYPVGIAVQE